MKKTPYLPYLAVIAALLLVIAHLVIWLHAPVELTMGLVQKIFYLHLPMAWWALLSFFLVFVGSVGVLLRKTDFWDALAGSAAELGVLFSGLALITGSLWARPIWNVWWTWDPRLTTALIMWFVYTGYLVLRTSPLPHIKRRTLCAVLGIVAFVDIPLVFFSTRLWRSIHPSVISSSGGGMEPEMWHAMGASLAAMGVLWLVLLIVRTRQITATQRLDSLWSARL
ncbi:heme exporter protein C [Desulfonatronum thiosulfatophilum]|uniref:Heme exporter protein C n=1 Tax=Desulfonatronum thiosulfatophilum TaxID=617002 RepID=A0A1G6AA46_9BACT|nr:cytochrome c biogenesis protein CcsA [Desulfonatronum thiosulfatophilum]SDB04903.1 heme exporter protein C [Desulfonatronum thiosulfatophilum]